LFGEGKFMEESIRAPKLKIRKGDMVKVLAGKDKGKTGKVLQVLGHEAKVFVEKVNLIKKHVRATKASKGGIVEKEGGLASSKVMLVCPQCEKPARVGRRLIESGNLLRYCKKCGEIIDKA
jgi:large subunit ribosomal protein L24